MDKDFAVRGESEPNTERFLKSDHILIQIHLERRRRVTRHCINPSNRLFRRSNIGSCIGEAQEISAPRKGGERAEEWRLMKSSGTGELKRIKSHFLGFGGRGSESEVYRLHATELKNGDWGRSGGEMGAVVANSRDVGPSLFATGKCSS